MNPALLALVIQETPTIVAGLKSLFARNNPAVPVPTDADVIEALHTALRSSLATDEAWLAQHPGV